MNARLFEGIYPGRVENNIDPLNMARIMVSVADVGGNAPLTWAMPCLPVSGRGMGMFTVPPVGSAVWVMFVRGDSDYPVWLCRVGRLVMQCRHCRAGCLLPSTASRCRRARDTGW